MSSDDDEPKTFGTLPLDAPVTRDDFERALRYLHLGDLELRDLVLRLAAQVVALTEELGRPLPPSDAAFARIRAEDAREPGRVRLETVTEDKYQTTGPPVPCAELMHLCEARCCKLEFELSTVDLDEGVIRWDYGRPYMIRQRASDGRCVHNHPTSHFCTVHTQRPMICRKYDCRHDPRIWIDFDKRILAPMSALEDPVPGRVEIDLIERMKARNTAEVIEDNALLHVYPDEEPRSGPPPSPRPPRRTR